MGTKRPGTLCTVLYVSTALQRSAGPASPQNTSTTTTSTSSSSSSSDAVAMSSAR